MLRLWPTSCANVTPAYVGFVVGGRYTVTPKQFSVQAVPWYARPLVMPKDNPLEEGNETDVYWLSYVVRCWMWCYWCEVNLVEYSLVHIKIWTGLFIFNKPGDDHRWRHGWRHVQVPYRHVTLITGLCFQFWDLATNSRETSSPVVDIDVEPRL
jgi:hypothetical protein